MTAQPPSPEPKDRSEYSIGDLEAQLSEITAFEKRIRKRLAAERRRRG